jgi:hypothetical protein
MDLYEQHHTNLVRVHAALGDALRAIVDAPTAIAAGQFLLGHHHAESAVLFPGLRRHGRLASDDVAFLDARDREHTELHGLCERLLGEAGRGAPRTLELRTIAGAILMRFLPHIAEEEEGLAPERLRRLIQPAGLAELGREMEALRKS